MLHGDDHEAWLDDRVPDWGDRDPDGLTAEVTPHAEAAEYREVFEDTVDRGRPDVDLGDRDHAGHDHGHARGGHGGPGVVDESGADDAETAAALREARELTREMLAEDGEERETGGADSDDAGGDDSDDSSA
jgi:hypothetical protein